MSTTVEENGFRSRLDLIMRQFGSVADLARAVGVSDNAIYKWVAGRGQPSMVSLIALARAAGVSVEWLATGNAPSREMGRSRGGSSIRLGYVFTPRGEVRVAGTLVRSDEIVDELAFRADWIRRRLGSEPESLLLLETIGDSMAPTLVEGDLVLADLHQTETRHDAIYVLREESELMVKRVQRRRSDRALVIRSDNPAYEPIVLPAERVTVVGRVIWAGGHL